MELYINGRFLTQRMTGVQRFAMEIVKRIAKYSKHKIIILVPTDYSGDHAFKNVEIKKIGKFSGHLWEQIDLVKYVKGKPLINLCNTSPILKKNQIVVIHDAAVYASPNGFSFAFRAWYKSLFFFTSKISKKILTISEFSTKELIKYLKVKTEKLGFITEGKEHFENVKENNEVLNKFNLTKDKYVFAVSSLNPNKNFEALVKATEYLQNQDFEVVIAGGTDPKVFGSTNIESNNVKYLGYITDEDLKGLYKNAGCFVFPSVYEGFGLPPLEAMSVGCPVLVSEVGPMPEVGGDASLYFDPYNPEELANKIQMVMKNEDLRAELKRKGQKQSSKFSWDLAAKQLIDHAKVLKA